LNSHYYLLENPNMAPQKVIIPDGRLIYTENGPEITNVFQEIKKISHVYEMSRRFGCLSAATIESRLHLAAVYAASGTNMREKRLGMTATEMAFKLVRQCWTSRPLSKSELEHLVNVIEVGSARCPSLHVLCEHIRSVSLELKFLFLDNTNGNE
jgi:predicted naringenin-chalcone synthase